MREDAVKEIMDEVDVRLPRFMSSAPRKLWFVKLIRSVHFQDQRPLRRVSNFRIIVIRDARTSSFPSSRRSSQQVLTAQLRVWNVNSLGEDFLVVGKRYLVSQLMPTCEGSWGEVSSAASTSVDGVAEKEIHLKTGSGTRWQVVGGRWDE